MGKRGKRGKKSLFNETEAWSRKSEGRSQDKDERKKKAQHKTAQEEQGGPCSNRRREVSGFTLGRDAGTEYGNRAIYGTRQMDGGVCTGIPKETLGGRPGDQNQSKKGNGRLGASLWDRGFTAGNVKGGSEKKKRGIFLEA